MGHLKSEPVNSKLEEIEENVYKAHCFNCGGKQSRLVLILEGNRKSQNHVNACTNPKCFRYWNLLKIPSWVLA